MGLRLCFIVLGMMISMAAYTQVYVRTDYVFSSEYVGENGKKIDGKGDLKVVEAGISIPVSVKMNTGNRPVLWSVNAGGAYAMMHHRNFPNDTFPARISNLQLSLIHVRPINAKWSLFALAGAGIFTDSNIGSISGRNVLLQGGVIFINQNKPNLDWGFGVVLNNSLGIPMVFPSIYLDWKTAGRYLFKVSFVETLELSAGVRMNKHINLNLTTEMRGLTAITEQDGASMMYGQFQIVAGLKPEFKIGKSLSIQVIAGASLYRSPELKTRKLKDLFKVRPEDYVAPYFKPTGYFSVGMKYHFMKK